MQPFLFPSLLLRIAGWAYKLCHDLRREIAFVYGVIGDSGVFGGLDTPVLGCFRGKTVEVVVKKADPCGCSGDNEAVRNDNRVLWR
jgi:hypothetical protein